MNRDTIKYMAMFAMLLNHIACMFMKPGSFWSEVLTDIGYFTAITMCYFLVEGYSYTRSKKKYALRLAVFAVVSEIPYYYAFKEAFGSVGMNMMFTLLLCFGILSAYENIRNIRLRNACILGLVLLSMFSDWAGLAPLFVVWFIRAEGDRKRTGAVFRRAAIIFGILNFLSSIQKTTVGMSILSALGSCLGIIASGIVILHLYNGKRMEKGRTFSKWFFYLFYPCHLTILCLIRYYFVSS